MKFLFVPDTEEIESKFNKIKDKFAFVDDVKSTINELQGIVSDENSAVSYSSDTDNAIFYIGVGENKWFEGKVQVVNLEWYKPYKVYGDAVFCCFAYAFFFWRIFIKLSSIISGVGGNVEFFKEGESKK